MNISGFIWRIADDVIRHVYDRTDAAISFCRGRSYFIAASYKPLGLAAQILLRQKKQFDRIKPFFSPTHLVRALSFAMRNG